MISNKLVHEDSVNILRVIVLGRLSTPYHGLESIALQLGVAEQCLRQVHTGPVSVCRLVELASGSLVRGPSIEVLGGPDDKGASQ